MAQLTRLDLHAEIDGRFPNNTTELITPPIVRAFLHNLVDSALLAASDKVTLSQALTLAQARALLTSAPPTVVPGLSYLITGNWNATGTNSTVYVSGLSNLAFHLLGVLLEGGGYSLVTLDVLAGTTTPLLDAYTEQQVDDLLALKADLVGGRVPEYELPVRAVGNIDYRNRLSASGGTLVISGGSYWHVSADVTLDLKALAFNEVFFLRISSYASNMAWTRLLATDGQLIGAYPQGTALLFRRTGYGTTDLAVVTVSSEYPSYANAFVPNTVKAAVTGGDYDATNRLTTTPAGSVATMQFADEAYLYYCFLDAQVTNGVLTYAWYRVARLGGNGSGTSPGTGAADLVTNIHFQALLTAGNAFSDLELFAPYELDTLDGAYNLSAWEAQVVGPDGLALSGVVNSRDDLNDALGAAFSAAPTPAFVLVRHKLTRTATTDTAYLRFNYKLV